MVVKKGELKAIDIVKGRKYFIILLKWNNSRNLLLGLDQKLMNTN